MDGRNIVKNVTTTMAADHLTNLNQQKLTNGVATDVPQIAGGDELYVGVLVGGALLLILVYIYYFFICYIWKSDSIHRVESRSSSCSSEVILFSYRQLQIEEPVDISRLEINQEIGIDMVDFEIPSYDEFVNIEDADLPSYDEVMNSEDADLPSYETAVNLSLQGAGYV